LGFLNPIPPLEWSRRGLWQPLVAGPCFGGLPRESFSTEVGWWIVDQWKSGNLRKLDVEGFWFLLVITSPKTNMEPENEPLEEEIPIKHHHFQVPC